MKSIASTLGDDLPKQNPWRDDALGFAPFAESIARVVIDHKAPNGYVIGVHGSWGSGKSTVINFVLAHIQKHNAENEEDLVEHIEFRPWIVSGHQDLIAAFFKVLTEKLGPKESRLRRIYRRVLRWFRGETDRLVDIVARLALVVDSSGATGAVAGSIAKGAVGAAIDKFLQEPSLQKIYTDLRQHLVVSRRKFLVTIDDIDRLDNEEVRAIMQLVKSIGQLPNVIYLLAYDRRKISEVLDSHSGSTSAAPRFAEKVVQYELDLPKPPRHRLLSMLDRENKALLAEGDESVRWYYIVREGVHRWIRSPRDVVRLSNALKFAWPALHGEIDPQDLLAMEGLRLFEPNVFEWIRDYRDLLFSHGVFSMSTDAARQAAVENLKQRIPEHSQPHVLHLVAVLFPQIAGLILGREVHVRETQHDMLRRRGVATEAGYDSYFGLHPSADAVPRAVVHEILSRFEDAEFVAGSIRSYIGRTNSQGRPLVSLLLEDLRVVGVGQTPPSPSLLEALFRVGQEVFSIERDLDVFELPARAQWQQLVRALLQSWGIEQARTALIFAFQRCSSVAVLSDVYVGRGRELGVFGAFGAPEEPVIDRETFQEIGAILLQKLVAQADDGTLKDAPFFFDIAQSWSHLDSEERVRQWLNQNLIEDPEFMRRVGLGLLRFSVGTAGKSYSFRDSPEASYYDLGAILLAGQGHLEKKELTSQQRAVIAELVRGAERFLRREEGSEREQG